MNATLALAAALALGLSPLAAPPSIEDAVRAALVDAVRGRAALPPDAEVELGELRVADRDLLDRAHRVSGVELPAGERGLSRVSARARLTLRGGGEAWTWVSASVDARVPAVVAARALERGRPLVRDDVVLTLEPMRPGLITDPADAVGLAPRRDFRAGEALGATWLSAPTVLERGDSVEITLQHGALSIRARGECLERGALGSDVRVRMAQSGRVVLGRVIDAKTVEVSP
jgi:flagella basal body P-ring formation protein FlgA